MLIVDQFEEIFTEYRHEARRQEFVTALCPAARHGPVLVVIGVRARLLRPLPGLSETPDGVAGPGGAGTDDC
ncbi:MAG: hypothetical protein ACRDSP_25830 [Pseudonocardiaceae bacterium]